MSKVSFHQSGNRKSDPLNLAWLFGQVQLIYILNKTQEDSWVDTAGFERFAGVP